MANILTSAGYTVAQEISDIYEGSGLVYVEVLVSVERDLQSDIIDRIREILSTFEEVNVTGFQPSGKYCTVFEIQMYLLIYLRSCGL